MSQPSTCLLDCSLSHEKVQSRLPSVPYGQEGIDQPRGSPSTTESGNPHGAR